MRLFLIQAQAPNLSNSKTTALCSHNCSTVLACVYIHTQTSNFTGDLVKDDWHTYTHPYPRLIACTNIYCPSTLTGAFPLFACSNIYLCTYFTSVGWVFLVEMVTLKTILYGIQTWSPCFLVSHHTFTKKIICNCQYIKIKKNSWGSIGLRIWIYTCLQNFSSVRL